MVCNYLYISPGYISLFDHTIAMSEQLETCNLKQFSECSLYISLSKANFANQYGKLIILI